MGGTSADIWHYDGEVEKDIQTKISDVFIKTLFLKLILLQQVVVL